MDLNVYSDLFKDVYGFRPRGELLQFASEEAFEAEFEKLANELDQKMDQDEVDEAKALAEFEAYLESMANDFGVDRATALRWDMEAEDKDDFGFYMYGKGVVSNKRIAPLAQEFGFRAY